MNKPTIKQVAWVGDDYIKGPIKGVVFFFHGLARVEMKYEPTTQELAWAEAGGLVVHPYYGAWNWMNRQARAFIDELVASLYKAYRLPAATPLVLNGESMGGQCALLYARYARPAIAACTVNCPVCDLNFAFNERPDVPRTIHFAFRGYRDSFPKLINEHSPLAQVGKMPDIPYLIIHGVKDAGVAKMPHSDKLVAAMRKRRLRVEYLEVAEMNHCSPVPPAVWMKQTEFVTRQFAQSNR